VTRFPFDLTRGEPLGANGATEAPVDAKDDRRLPLVPLFAAPPHSYLAARGYPVGGEVTVLRRVPLRGDAGQRGDEVVVPGEQIESGTDGAAGVLGCTGVHRRLPLVPLYAATPHLRVRTREYLGGGEVAVAGGMPLRGDVKELVRERLSGFGWARGAHTYHVCGRVGVRRVPGEHLTTGMNGAAGPPTGAAVDCRLPLVSLLATPPHFRVRTREYLGGGEVAVAGGMPLRVVLRCRVSNATCSYNRRMPAARNQAIHPAILEAAHTLAAGRFAEAIHDEAARVAAAIFDDRSGDPRALPLSSVSSVHRDDVVRVVEAALAEAIHDEASRVAVAVFDDRSGDPWALPRPPVSSVDHDDVVRVVEAALAEATGASLRDEVARALMLTPPARSRGRSAVTALLGLITGTTRQGVEARLRLRERLPGDLEGCGSTSGCS